MPTALLGAQTASLYGWRTIRGLRQQRSCGFLCGDGPAFTQGFDKGLLARCFFRKPPYPSLTLRVFRKPTSPPLPLRKAPHLSPSLSLLRRERMCQPPYSVLKPLRYMVGGPSEVYASSGAADFCAGMDPLSLKDLIKGCLLVAFFENLPILP